jgi:enterochelin esterase-like enzyme
VRLDRHEIQSEALRGNPLGDPSLRPLWISVPEGDGPWPTIYVIQGMGGRVDTWLNRWPMRKTVFELLDDEPPAAILVWVDAYTALGGSQYLDSPAIGNYHTYLCDEVVPWVDGRYPTLAAAEHRGIAGKSSGGTAQW